MNVIRHHKNNQPSHGSGMQNYTLVKPAMPTMLSRCCE